MCVYVCESCDSLILSTYHLLAVIDKQGAIQITTHNASQGAYNRASYRIHANNDMDPSYAEFLQVNRVFLITSIQVRNTLLVDHLYSLKIIDKNTREKIEGIPVNQDQAKALVDALETDTSGNFEGFLKALNETGQHDAADKLRNKWEAHLHEGKSTAICHHHVISFPMFSFSFPVSCL